MPLPGVDATVRRMSPAGRAGLGRGARWTAALLPLLALIAHGCAPVAVPPSPSRPLPSKRPAAKARPLPGYESRIDDFAAVDTSALRGHRIALDPGHGGVFRGALGVHGLTEAEVNLGVALHLRGLLEARGAQVLMTRTNDRDFLTPADSSLRSDLAERTRIANAFHPDLFVSIHHNADARGAHDVNETQTYYKLRDEGPSLDAAQSVHRFLVRNLGIAEHRILPGNYFVLRNSEAPAILTESSYITNPDVESKLALAAKQRLEAEALYLGLAHYFARPAPVIEEFRVYALGRPGEDSAFVDPQLRIRGRVRGAFDQARLTVDDEEVEPQIHGGDIEWAASTPLAVGAHEATLSVALAGAGTARSLTRSFHVASRRDKIVAEFPDQASWDAGQPLGLRVRLLDANGLANRDSAWVRVRDVGGRSVTPADTQIVIADGAGWAYFRPAARTSKSAARGSTEVRLDVGLTPRVKGAAAVDATPRVQAGIGSGGSRPSRTRTAIALRMPQGEPLRGAPGTFGATPTIEWINRDGFVRLPRDSSGAVRTPRLAGYRPWPTDADWPPRFTAIARGVLHGRRIVLDPDGGGDEDGGTGPSGTRAANVNLDVARALAGMLEAAGADVALTRSGDFALSDVERVQINEAFRADHFVRIGHRAERPMVGYYFSSAPGRRWAERTARMLAALGAGAPAVAEDAQYPLQQTSCPALYVSPARVDDAASEQRLAGPGAVRTEAYAVYLALIGEWSDAVLPIDSLTVRDPEGRPAAGAIVTLGQSTLLQTGLDGVVRFARTEPGPIGVEVTHPRIHTRRVLLDSESGMILTGTETR